MVAQWWIAEGAAESDDAVDRKVRTGWLFRDLVAIDAEFDQLTIAREQRTIEVRTEPIELEGVYLGRFAIRLQWQQEREQRPSYRILPLDECSSRSMPEVCHPHVSHNVLCEGDASWPIRQALQDIRLHDFFLIVSRVLESYNSQSPYMDLSHWDSESCDGCGDLIDDGDFHSCRECGDAYCSGCLDDCPGCDEAFCSSCLTACPKCDCKSCESCFAECRECGGFYCSDCLVEEICHDCEAKQLAKAENAPAGAKQEDSPKAEAQAEV